MIYEWFKKHFTLKTKTMVCFFFFNVDYYDVLLVVTHKKWFKKIFFLQNLVVLSKKFILNH